MIPLPQTAHHITAASCLDVSACHPAVDSRRETSVFESLAEAMECSRQSRSHSMASALGESPISHKDTGARTQNKPWQTTRYPENPEPETRMKLREPIRPNHAMEPTPVAVTVLAYARTAPSTSVAHLER
jgi:hypothetical protein